jgi:hypothetical protein
MMPRRQPAARVFPTHNAKAIELGAAAKHEC